MPWDVFVQSDCPVVETRYAGDLSMTDLVQAVDATIKTALQHGISGDMAERHPRKIIWVALKASDGPPQGRKRACACAVHAPLLGNPGLSVAAD